MIICLFIFNYSGALLDMDVGCSGFACLNLDEINRIQAQQLRAPSETWQA